MYEMNDVKDLFVEFFMQKPVNTVVVFNDGMLYCSSEGPGASYYEPWYDEKSPVQAP